MKIALHDFFTGLCRAQIRKVADDQCVSPCFQAFAQDFAEAEKWYEKAAAKNITEAQTRLPRSGHRQWREAVGTVALGRPDVGVAEVGEPGEAALAFREHLRKKGAEVPAELDDPTLRRVLSPSPEEQRLVQIYRKRGLNAVVGFWSTSTAVMPRRPNSLASISPLGPPPTISTSVSNCSDFIG